MRPRTRRRKKPAGALNLPRVGWEGGCGYWAQHSKARSASWHAAGFFPIAVFLGKPDSGHPASLRTVGVNTYLAAEYQGGDLTELNAAGMFSIIQSPISHSDEAPDIWTQAQIGTNANVVGWFIYDECEMAEGRCSAIATDALRISTHQGWTTSTRAFADGRFMFANYGNGVLNTFWAPGTMDQWITHVDATGCDKYGYTSPGVRFEFGRSDDYIADGGTEANAQSSAVYGWISEAMLAYGNRKFPYWCVVESKMPFLSDAGRSIITYAQIEGAVWSALANEARGICYFQQNGFYGAGAPATDPNTGIAPTEETYSLVDGGTGLRNAVAAVNSAVMRLAPVLNTQSYTWNCGATGVVTMLKKYQGQAYVFASLGVGASTGSKTLTLPRNVRGRQAMVVNESRTLPVVGRSFTDTFASEYTHHVYKVVI